MRGEGRTGWGGGEEWRMKGEGRMGRWRGVANERGGENEVEGIGE